MLIKLLTKLQYWKDRTIEYGFYTRYSYCSVGTQPEGRRKGRLMLAWGKREFVIKYL